MKILHTSDWHLGHNIYGHDTLEDQRVMLASIERICVDERPDVMIICGDVFDTARPGMGVQKMFVDALHRLRVALPQMRIAVIAGNHDSASMHEVFAAPWKDLDVLVAGEARGDIASMAARTWIIGGIGAIVPIPYFPDRFMPDGYLEDILTAAVKDIPAHLPVVVMLHATVEGCDIAGHRSDEDGSGAVGGIVGIRTDTLPDVFDYLALGHIHRPQTIDARIRYSGSPRRLSFDEDYPHSVTITVVDNRGDIPEIREVEIPEARKFITLPADGVYGTWEEICAAAETSGCRNGAFVRANVSQTEHVSPVEAALLRERLAVTDAILCVINREPVAATGESADETIDMETFRTLKPVDVARRYFSAMGLALDEEQCAMIEEVTARVVENERK